MNKLFENTTIYTSDEYEKFLQFHNKRYGFSHDFYTFFMLAVFLFCTIFHLYNDSLNLGILFILITLSFLTFRFFWPILFVKKEFNSGKISAEARNTFSFFTHFFEVKSNNGFAKVIYIKLYKVYETKDSFYLYINKNYSFILSKSNFSIGNSSDFSKFIKKKCWYKYKYFEI